jgi:hypothetical protein
MEEGTAETMDMDMVIAGEEGSQAGIVVVVVVVVAVEAETEAEVEEVEGIRSDTEDSQ